MEHVLDNPVWHALNSGNRSLAHGSGDIRYFWNDVSPFAGLRDNSVDQLRALHEWVPFEGPLAVASATEVAWPTEWTVNHAVEVWQMVCNRGPSKSSREIDAVPLDESAVPEMLALTELTRPGPFAQNTIRFGHYEGIYDGGRLVAMAGQRMRPTPYVEVSAVCTHPDFLGKGLATQLMLRQVRLIRSTGEIPFLHVKSDNERAIHVYTQLGFHKRRKLVIYFVQKSRSA